MRDLTSTSLRGSMTPVCRWSRTASVGIVPPSAAGIVVGNIECFQQMERGQGPTTWGVQMSFIHGVECLFHFMELTSKKRAWAAPFRPGHCPGKTIRAFIGTE